MSGEFLITTSPSTTTFGNAKKEVSISNPFEDCFPVFVVASLPLKEKFHLKLTEIVQSSFLVGVTTLEPSQLTDTVSEVIFSNSWFLQSNQLYQNCRDSAELYQLDLRDAFEGDYISVELNEANELHFYLNGCDGGPAGCLPGGCYYPIVGMLGKRLAVAISTFPPVVDTGNMNGDGKLCCKSSVVEVSEKGVLATRIGNDFEEANIVSSKPLTVSEKFVIRLERIDERWTGALDFGLVFAKEGMDAAQVLDNVTHLPKIFLRECEVLSDIDVCIQNYSPIPLDQLIVGDLVSIYVRDSAEVSFQINNIDLGSLPLPVKCQQPLIFAYVKLYGTTVKIRLVNDHTEQSMLSLRNHDNLDDAKQPKSVLTAKITEEEETMPNFNPNELIPCIDFAFATLSPCLQVSNNNLTVCRNDSQQQNCIFLFGIPDIKSSMLNFRVDTLTGKGIGPLALGICPKTAPLGFSYSSSFLAFHPNGLFRSSHETSPTSLSFVKFREEFNSLQVGSLISCQIDNNLFTVTINNSESWTVYLPEEVEGCLFVDLSFQVNQLSIRVDDLQRKLYRPEQMKSLAFHTRHGPNCRVEDHLRLAAFRPEPTSEFSDAILMSNRPLADNEMFEIRIDSIVTLWSGSLEIGLTRQDPEKIVFPKTMTQITKDIWMISGSAVVHNGDTVWNNYKCDFDQLKEGSTVGVMRASDATMRVFVNGTDQGIACVDVPEGVYAIADLYGQCNRVTIQHPDQGQLPVEEIFNTGETNKSRVPHTFFCRDVSAPERSENSEVSFENNQRVARFVNSCGGSTMLFSDQPISPGETFSIKIDLHVHEQKPCNEMTDFRLGLSNFDPHFSSISFVELEKDWFTFFWHCGHVKINGESFVQNYSPSLGSLIASGMILSLHYSQENKISFACNDFVFSEVDFLVAENCYVFLHSESNVKSLELVSSKTEKAAPRLIRTRRKQSNSTAVAEATSLTQGINVSPDCGFLDHPRGENIQFTSGNKLASRLPETCSHGVAIVKQFLEPTKAIMFTFDEINPSMKLNFSIGIIESSKLSQFVNVVEISAICKHAFTLTRNGVWQRNNQLDAKLAIRESWIQKGNSVGLLLDNQGVVHLMVNKKIHGTITTAANTSDLKFHPFVDLNGSVTKCKVWTHQVENPKTECVRLASVENSKDINGKCFQDECDYLKLCKEFRSILKLPKAFFAHDSKGSFCYCKKCNQQRDTETSFKQGEPLKPFTLPVGWCKFNLRLKSPKGLLPNYSTWHVAYHCPSWKQLRKILDRAELIIPSESQLRKPKSSRAKIGDDAAIGEKLSGVLLLSPTVNYCSSDTHCPKIPFLRAEGSLPFTAKVALQVWIKPGAYTSSAPSIDPQCVFDKDIPLNEHEWISKEESATFVSALLIKVDRSTD